MKIQNYSKNKEGEIMTALSYILTFCGGGMFGLLLMACLSISKINGEEYDD